MVGHEDAAAGEVWTDIVQVIRNIDKRNAPPNFFVAFILCIITPDFSVPLELPYVFTTSMSLYTEKLFVNPRMSLTHLHLPLFVFN